MADNVNIIVQDTINDIVVNAAVVVETIDINVQAAVDTVDIVANPNNYVVNINRIIGEQVQSDWDQADNQAPDYIKNKPTIPAPQVNSDWDATSGVAEILNKPTIPAAVTKTSDLVNDGENGVDPFITAADIPPVTGFVPYTGATDDVNLGTHDLTATQGTFATSGNPDTLTVNHSSGSGKALTITKGGAGEGIYVNKTSGSGNAVTIVGDLEATNLKRTSGTSSQFLKADGSVDSNTYFELPALTSGSVLFSNGSTIAQDNAQLFWDDTNNRLGIGTTNFVGSIKLAVNGQIGGPTFSGTFLNLTGGTPELRGNSGISFYGAGGNIIFYGTSSAERMRLFANGNLAINSTTDAGFKLDVNGTARVQGNATFGTLGTGTGMFWDNTNNRLGIGTSSPTTTLDVRGLITTQQATLPSFAANGSIMVGGSNVSNLAGVLMGVQIPYVTGAFGGHSIGYSNQTNPKWLIGLSRNLAQENALIYYEDSSAASARLTLFPGGNIGINTTTNGGYRLDVNGTARVQTSISLANATGVGRIILPETGTTSADGIGFGSYFIHRSSAGGIRFSASNSSRYLEFSSGSTFSSITAAGATSQLTLNTNVTNSVSASIGGPNNSVFVGRNGAQSNTLMFIRNGSLLSTGNILELQNYLGSVAVFDINGRLILGGSNISNSAILQADSTTKGFLPPRMTTTEKNAIATPAAGLMIYDNTLNRPCFYDGTTWITL